MASGASTCRNMGRLRVRDGSSVGYDVCVFGIGRRLIMKKKELLKENDSLKAENEYLTQKLMQTEKSLLRLRNWLDNGMKLTTDYRPKHAREYREG